MGGPGSKNCGTVKLWDSKTVNLQFPEKCPSRLLMRPFPKHHQVIGILTITHLGHAAPEVLTKYIMLTAQIRQPDGV